MCWINKCLEDNTTSDVRPFSYWCRSLVKKRLYQLTAMEEYFSLCRSYLKLSFPFKAVLSVIAGYISRIGFCEERWEEEGIQHFMSEASWVLNIFQISYQKDRNLVVTLPFCNNFPVFSDDQTAVDAESTPILIDQRFLSQERQQLTWCKADVCRLQWITDVFTHTSRTAKLIYFFGIKPGGFLDSFANC